MLSLKIGNEEHSCLIIRTSRKRSIGIEVSPYRGIVVHAPYKLNSQRIVELLNGSARWIEKRLKQLGEAPFAFRTFKTGGRFLFQGEWLDLQILPAEISKISVQRQENFLVVLVPQETDLKTMDEVIKDALAKWYRTRARKIITARIEHYGPTVGVPVPPIRINNARRRWGSCGVKGRLNFPWRLVMAPLSLIDYVVVHELCHLLKRDHSSAFWRLVAAILPDYRQRRRQLRLDGQFFDL